MSSQRTSRSGLRFLRLREVCRITGLSRSMIYQLQGEHRFPQSIKLTERAVGWIEQEVQEWMTARVTERRPSPTARRTRRPGNQRD
ncbi:MAG: helix-turn-helix transcriptional regulator [bacterium]